MKKILLTLMSLTFLAGGPFANAGTHVWSGAVNGYWTTPGNWSSGGVPQVYSATPVVILFPSDASARRQTTNNINNLKVDVLGFYGGNYEMYGENTLTLTGNPPPSPYTANLISGGSTNNFIDAYVSMVLSNNVTVLVGTNATLEWDAWLSGPGGLTKTGPGRLWFSGLGNSFQGPTTVLDGTIVSDARVYGWFDQIGTPVVTISGDLIIGDTNMTHSPKVQMLDGLLGFKPLTINPNGALELYYGASASSLTLTGGKLRFMPNPYYYEEWLTNYASFYCGSNLTVSPTRLGTAKIEGPGDFHFYTTNYGAPSFINVQADKLIMEADLSGTTTVHKTGPGEWIWKGSDYYINGDFLIEQGLLAVSGYTPFLDDSVTVSNGAQISVRGACGGWSVFHLNGFGLGGTNGALVVEQDGATFSASFHFDSDTAIVVTNAADKFTAYGTYIGGIWQHFEGPGNLHKKGRGTLQITGNQTNSMAGVFYVDQGTLALNNTQHIAAVNSPLVIGHDADGTMAEVKLLNEYQFPVTVPITINDSGTLNLNGYYHTVGPLTLQGGDIKTLGGTLYLSSDVLATNGVGSIISGSLHMGNAKRTFHLAPGYGVNILGQVSDIGTSVGFDVDGGGTLTLSGANTALLGPIHLKRGVLYARSDWALGDSSAGTTIDSGARLAIDGRYLGAEPIFISGDGGGYGALSCSRTNTLTGPITFGSDVTFNVVSPTDRLILGGTVSGVGALNKMGYGTLEMTGNYANTYSGMTTVVDGTLELSKSGNVSVPAGLVIGDAVSPFASQIVRILSANQLGHNGPVTVHQSGVLDLSSAFFAPQTIGSLAGTGPVKLGVSPLSAGADNTDTSYGGQITGTGSLLKQGTGTWQLGTLSDQYLGVTVVNAGTLKVQNSIQFSPVTVNAGGTLAGHGTVANVTSVGGTLSPGCCPTSMKLSSKNLSLDSASIFHAGIHGTNNGAYIYTAQANVSGTVNLGGATLTAALGFNSVVGNKFTIIANDGVEDVNGTFKGLLEGATFPVGTALMQITYKGGTGNDVVLTHIGSVAAPQIGSIESLPNGQKKITGTGYPGLTYTVEASTDLKSWMAIGTATASSPGGELSFIDPDAPNFQYRFYRFMAP